MNKKLYQILNWRDIEEIVYAESSDPQRLLGPHALGKDTLIQAYFPGSKEAELVFEDACMKKLGFAVKSRKLELVDENGYYALLLPGVKPSELKYKYRVISEREEKEIPEVYQFDSYLNQEQMNAFTNGNMEHARDFLGCRKVRKKGLTGILFSVYCPGAMRVSVVGEFNHWDGRMNPMNRVAGTGFFELLIPELREGEPYQYEIHLKNGITYVKNDPFTVIVSEDFKSCVKEPEGYRFGDEEWMKQREGQSATDMIHLYELNLPYFDACKKSAGTFRTIVENIVKEVKETGYTHVVVKDAIDGVTAQNGVRFLRNYFAVSSMLERSEDLMVLIDKLHQAGIGVLFEFDASMFLRDSFGLHGFDGTDYFEDTYRSREYSDGFDYTKKCVQNYLYSCLFYWFNHFHFDGVRLIGLAEMLYLDYGHMGDDYRRNCNGGKENLEAVSWVRNMNTLLHRDFKGILTIADELKVWEKVTASVRGKGLGFDLNWNAEYCDLLYEFFSRDPLFRTEFDSRLFQGIEKKENWLLPSDCIQRGEYDFNCDALAGDEKAQKDNLKLRFAYRMLFPGQKLTLQKEAVRVPVTMIQAMNRMLLTDPIERKKDTWIPFYLGTDGVVGIKASTRAGKHLLIVVNFANTVRETYELPVREPGKYQEIFHSDSVLFDGMHEENKKPVASQSKEQNNILSLSLPALSVCVFTYQTFTQQEMAAIERRKKESEERERKRQEERRKKEDERLQKEASMMRQKEVKSLEELKKRLVKQLADLDKELQTLRECSIEQYRKQKGMELPKDFEKVNKPQ